MVTYPTAVDYNKIFLSQFATLKEEMLVENEKSLYSEASSIFSYGYIPEILAEAKGDRQGFFRQLLTKIRQIWQMFLTNIEQLVSSNIDWVESNKERIRNADFDKIIGNGSKDSYQMWPYFRRANEFERNQVPAFNKTDKTLLEALTSAETFRTKYFQPMMPSGVTFTNENLRMFLRGVENFREPENDKTRSASGIRQNIDRMISDVVDYKKTQAGLDKIHKEIEATVNEVITEERKRASQISEENFYVRLEGDYLTEMTHDDYRLIYEYTMYSLQADLFHLMESDYFADCDSSDAERKVFGICENLNVGDFKAAKNALHGFHGSLAYMLTEEHNNRLDFNETVLKMFDRLDALQGFVEDKEFKYVKSLQEADDVTGSTKSQADEGGAGDPKKNDADAEKVKKEVVENESASLVKKYELYIKEAQSFCSIKMSIFEEKNKAYIKLFKMLVGNTVGNSDKAKPLGSKPVKDAKRSDQEELDIVKGKIAELQRISNRTNTQEGELSFAKKKRAKLEKKLKIKPDEE